MGAEGWREAWVMDFIRGNMMHQLWGDLSLLNEDDLKFMERIAQCTRENAELLKHPKRILGSPWRGEPYGYACCAGDRGVIAIHNAQWVDETVRLAMDETIGLTRGKKYDVRWIYKDGSIEPKSQVVESALEVALNGFEVCLAQITATDAPLKAQIAKPVGFSPRSIPARFVQTSYSALNWNDPSAQKRLAVVVNGRTTPTNNPDTLAVGPDRSDERDRDIVEEKFATNLALDARQAESKLFVILRFDRDGIAWHHLAPFLIMHVTAIANGQSLKVKTTPHKMHEQAGGWSWILHEFDVPPGVSGVALSVDAVHPKTMVITMEVWHR
jgi:hypothetical protein